MFVISYQFVGGTVEHKQIFVLLETTLILVRDLLMDTNKPLIYVRISPKV